MRLGHEYFDDLNEAELKKEKKELEEMMKRDRE